MIRDGVIFIKILIRFKIACEIWFQFQFIHH